MACETMFLDSRMIKVFKRFRNLFGLGFLRSFQRFILFVFVEVEYGYRNVTHVHSAISVGVSIGIPVC